MAARSDHANVTLGSNSSTILRKHSKISVSLRSKYLLIYYTKHCFKDVGLLLVTNCMMKKLILLIILQITRNKNHLKVKKISQNLHNV